MEASEGENFKNSVYSIMLASPPPPPPPGIPAPPPQFPLYLSKGTSFL